MTEHVRPPRTARDVVHLFEQGRVSPAEAFQLFRELERPREPSLAANGKPRARNREGEDDEAARRRRLKAVMKELDGLVGLREVKRLVREVQAFVEIQQRRRDEQLAAEPLVLHMIFAGNPGTGKTTVARIFGRMFREMGVLPKGHLIESERADLVGEYIGHTAQKTREQLKKAMGGILFIDEAYALARGGEKDFGKEAIDTLVKAMEDHKDEVVLILAGYRREMAYFLETNPGLHSRFPIHIDFPDYSTAELLRIADLMLEKRQYKLTQGARRGLEARLRANLDEGASHFGNARLVRNVIERSVRRQAVRLVRRGRVTREELMAIEMEDLEAEAGEAG